VGGDELSETDINEKVTKHCRKKKAVKKRKGFISRLKRNALPVPPGLYGRVDTSRRDMIGGMDFHTRGRRESVAVLNCGK